jgi:lysophospholipase L1-like esterase
MKFVRSHAVLISLAILFTVQACMSPSRPDVAQIEDVVTLDDDTRSFLDQLQRRTFNWFWETTDPKTGLVHDRYPRRAFSSIAAIGFGLPTYAIGVERGYVSRQAAAERTLTTLRFMYNLPQGPQQTGVGGYKGFFYHFLEYGSGHRYRTNELSTIDTSLLMGGVLFSREYFDGGNETEQMIRAYSDSLYQRVEWDFYISGTELRPNMAWHPETRFGRAMWQGYNEGMILYILGLGSPTYPLPAESWDAWVSTYEWADYYGYEHVNFEPLFGHQYSHIFVDFKGIRDEYMRERTATLGEPFDYFENSRRAVLSQRAYAIDNPMGWKDYSADIWGLTASDGPSDVEREYNGKMRRFRTYSARGVSAQRVSDDGTLAPTALGGSIPFAPNITISALRTMIARYGDNLWNEYGFRDAFNPSFTYTDAQLKPNSEVTDQGWFDHEYVGIDQGPIIIMAENYRTGFVWQTLKKSPYIIDGLRRAGFEGGWLDGASPTAPSLLAMSRQPMPGDAADDTRLIVVLGSSTAEGVGPIKSDNTWVNRFRVRLRAVDERYDVLNLARGGYTTYRIIPESVSSSELSREGRPAVDPLRNIDAALSRNPVAIIVNMPSNDAASGFSVEEQMRNFEFVATAAESAGVPMWITTPLPRDLDELGRRAQFELKDALYQRFGDRVIDFWEPFATEDGDQKPEWDSGDNLHYNDAAHKVMADAVGRSLLDGR